MPSTISETVAPGGVDSNTPMMPWIGDSAISTLGALPCSTVTCSLWLRKPGGGSIWTVWLPGAMPRIRDGRRSVRLSPSSFQLEMPPGVT